MSKEKVPTACQSIEEVRSEIDALDRQIISLLGRRFTFVKEIVRFKSNSDEIVARERYDEVIRSRRELAKQHHLSPDVIEKIYRMLIAHNIEEEHKILNGKK
jgi:isochorismate pyruvate lyase